MLESIHSFQCFLFKRISLLLKGLTQNLQLVIFGNHDSELLNRKKRFQTDINIFFVFTL